MGSLTRFLLLEFSSGAAAAPPTNTGLVGYWKMDEATWQSGGSPVAGAVIDSSGNGNHGTEANGAETTATNAKFNRSGSFAHASNQYIDCGNNASLYPSSTLTLAAWVNPAAVNVNQAIAGPWNSGAASNNGYLLGVGIRGTQDEKVSFWIEQTNNTIVKLDPTSGNSLVQNTWSHVVGVADGSNLHLYLNGVDCGTTAAYDGTIDNNAITNFWIGRILASASFGWDGLLDEVRVYNRALSATEVAALFALVPT